MSGSLTPDRRGPTDRVPATIDRATLDKIIQRAAELQTGEREVGDHLTPDEVLALGKDVGIPAKYLQQAMLEHQATAAVAPDQSFTGRIIGPADLQAHRVVQGDTDDVLEALLRWMEKNELMVVQRQQANWISWEPLRGMQAAIRRGAASLDTSKPKFMLSRAEVVIATVTPLERGYSHVTLSAKLRNARRDLVIGASVATGLGVGGSVTLAALGALSLVAALPVGLGLLIGGVVLRSYPPIAERVQLGLERALDFLERGGVKPAHELPKRGPGLLDLLATEVRRALTSGETGQPRPKPKDRP